MLSKQHRLSRQDQVDFFRTSKRVYSPLFTVAFKPVAAGSAAFAISVSKKHAPTAVARNKIKRQIRHVLSGFLSKNQLSVHVMVMLKPPAYQAAYSDLKTELTHLLQKL